MMVHGLVVEQQVVDLVTGVVGYQMNYSGPEIL